MTTEAQMVLEELRETYMCKLLAKTLGLSAIDARRAVMEIRDLAMQPKRS